MALFSRNLGSFLFKHQVTLIDTRRKAKAKTLKDPDWPLQVFGALMEYGVILLLLKKRLKPKYSISFGLRKMFPNGDTSSQQQQQQQQHHSRQQQQQPAVKKRRSPGSPSGNAAAMLGVGEIEEQKPMVKGL